jgi:hypothetical protein
MFDRLCSQLHVPAGLPRELDSQVFIQEEAPWASDPVRIGRRESRFPSLNLPDRSISLR